VPKLTSLADSVNAPPERVVREGVQLNHEWTRTNTNGNSLPEQVPQLRDTTAPIFVLEAKSFRPLCRTASRPGSQRVAG